MTLRDSLDQAKLRVVKILVATVNRKMFVFYNHNQTFIDIFNQMKSYFQLTHTIDPDFLKSSGQFNQQATKELIKNQKMSA